MKYDIYFSVFGKKMLITIETDGSVQDAVEKAILRNLKIFKIEKQNEMFDAVKNMFGFK